jgi:hypothetical protein
MLCQAIKNKTSKTFQIGTHKGFTRKYTTPAIHIFNKILQLNKI